MLNSDSTLTLAKTTDLPKEAIPFMEDDLAVALLTGGQDRSYALGLAMALCAKGIRVEVIGNELVDSTEFHTTPKLSFLNMGGIPQPDVGFSRKLFQVLQYYARLIRYVAIAKPRLFHILWNSKLEYFDRTVLMIYFKFFGKRVILTAHNVNKARRDSEDSLLNRLTLRFQYHLTDRIFTHTEKMKTELIQGFGVGKSAVRVIPFGVNSTLPDTSLTPEAAKRTLGITSKERTILFFGRIVPYKGLEYLLAAFETLNARNPNYRLIIAGEPMKGYERYVEDIQRAIDQSGYADRVIQKFQFIPDKEAELYFKAADALALPYKDIFQSGVLFLGFAFGLPAIAADVGSFREDLIIGKTGYVFNPGDSAELANALETYFESDLYKRLNDKNRQEIRDQMKARHSWDKVGHITREVYKELVNYCQ